MEKRVDSIVFRRLTYADFKHIHHKGSHYEHGGGQSYIDFPKISMGSWENFLGKPTGSRTANRPEWRIEINSLGFDSKSKVTIYNRRGVEVCIGSQKIESKKSERVPAWHPNKQFPKDYNDSVDHLVIYILKTSDNLYWAGWFLENGVPFGWEVNGQLRRMFDEEGGYIEFKTKIFMETENKKWPFYLKPKTVKNQIKTEEDTEEDLLNEDTSPQLSELGESKPKFQKKILRIRERNSRLVKKLKNLYKGHCQISGNKFTFKKKNGELYSEIHHLIPLGENGSDSYANAIVVSPLIHRMLHYANVLEIDLSQIKNSKLKISINQENYQIIWHPDHLKTVEESLKD